MRFIPTPKFNGRFTKTCAFNIRNGLSPTGTAQPANPMSRLAELIGLSNPLNATRPLLNSAEPFDLKEYPANMKPTLELTEANFETEVVKSSQPVLVEFATGWSLPSMMLDEAMDEIAGEFVDCLKVGRVNLDSSPNLGLWYGIG